MNKDWQQFPVDLQNAKYISDNFSVSLLSGQIFSLYSDFQNTNYNRQWLYPKLKDLPINFSLLPDLDKLFECIINAQCIGIISDYDADGVLSFVMWHEYLTKLEKKIVYYIPERNEGYGPNDNAVKFLLNKGANVILALDCGTHYNWSNINIDICIIDHHLTSIIPRCAAFVNPYRPDFDHINIEYYLNICTAGLTFIILKFFDKKLEKKYASNLIDLAAVATIADMMPLVKYNRALVSAGMRKLNINPSLGLELIITKKMISSTDISFFIAPKINSAGRLNNVNCIIKVMQGDSNYLDQLNEMHDRRKQICTNIMNNLENLCVFSGCVIVNSELITSGLAGIIASRIKEQYKKITFAFSYVNGFYIGSGRSVEGFNLGFWLQKQIEQGICAGGGHAGAVGAVIAQDQYTLFLANAEKIVIPEQPKYQYYCAETTLSGLMLNSSEFDLLEPFGVGNIPPRFLIRQVNILNIRQCSDIFSKVSLKDLTGAVNVYAFNLNSKLKVGNFNLILEYLGKSEYKILDLWGE